MRSERAYSRWISFILVFFAICIALLVGWLAWRTLHTPKAVTRDHPVTTGPTLVIQGRSLAPLQANRAKRTAAAKSPDSRVSSSTPSQSATTQTRPAAKTVSPKTTPSHRTPAKKRTPSASKPHTTTQPAAPSPPAQTQPAPPPLVTVPLPSVCTKPIHIGTCP